MSLIEKLVEIRLRIFMKEFDININSFGFYSLDSTRKILWEKLKQKFIKYNLVTNNHNAFDCYLVINNIIWKNIMAHQIIDNKIYIYMYHNFQNVSEIYHNKYEYNPVLLYDILLYKKFYEYPEQKNNCIILQTKIINYFMLLDALVTKYMISDLKNMFKRYIYDVILVL